MNPLVGSTAVVELRTRTPTVSDLEDKKLANGDDKIMFGIVERKNETSSTTERGDAFRRSIPPT